MNGLLFLISGLTGSGKTTFARAVTEQLPNFEYLQTVTTRPRRASEKDSIEYDFVSPSEYAARMKASANWDHNEIHGNQYGADVAEWDRKTKQGINLICTIAPDLEVIEQTRRLYQAKLVTIWLDVPADIARSRVADDANRAARYEEESVEDHFNFSYTPTGNLGQDTSNFIEFIYHLLQNNVAGTD